MVVFGCEQCTLPELAIALADKGRRKYNTGEQRACAEKDERNSHHQRRFMRLMRMAMIVVVVAMRRRVVIIGMAMRVMSPTGLTEERQEEQTP